MATNQFNPIPVTPVPYGQVVLDGQPYIERHQLFVADVQIDFRYQELTGLRLTMPGVANFLLKGLSRDITHPGFPSLLGDIFRFRIVNAEGTVWYFTGGLGIFDDRVISTLCFGSGQFPFPLVPPIPIHANGSLIYEIQDVGERQQIFYPYIIHLGFHGAYLIPATGAGAGTGPLAFPGGTTSGTLRTG